MSNYKKMYLELFDATEQAINSLIAAQRRCEEIYMFIPEANNMYTKAASNNDEQEEMH